MQKASAGRGQAAKFVRYNQRSRRRVQRCGDDRYAGAERPLEGAAKRRRTRLVGADHIPVAPLGRAPASVESVPHQVLAFHPDLLRQQRVQRATELLGLCDPPLCGDEPDALAQRMHARVGTPRARRRRVLSHQPLEDGLKLALDRAGNALPLPPREAGPVVVDHGEEGAARHGGKMQLVVTI